MARVEEFAALVPESLRDEPGRVFYSGWRAFESENNLYVLGLNSSGDPGSVADSVQSNIDRVLRGELENWSRYEEGNNPFHHGMLHLFKNIGRDPKTVPASNLVFLRSQSAKSLGRAQLKRLATCCWCFHRAVIEKLNIRVVVCLGTKAGKAVRGFLNAFDPPIDSFVEDNDRKWRSYTVRNSDGIFIVQLTHPSRAYWTACPSDPTGLVRSALECSQHQL